MVDRWKKCFVVGYKAAEKVFGVIWPSENPKLPDTAGVLGRLDVCFKAEDPSFFADRVFAAYEARMHAESQMRLNLYIDCMPTEDLCQLDSEQVNRIMSSAMSASQLHQNTVDTSQLLNEVVGPLQLFSHGSLVYLFSPWSFISIFSWVLL